MGVSPMITGPLFVTPHAVRQYRARYRWREGLSFGQAMGDLIKLCDRARYVKDLESGAQLWKTGRPEKMRFVVREMPQGPAVVTVLPVRRKS